MIIYIVNVDEDNLITIEYGDIADLAQFHRELTEQHGDDWYDSFEDAMGALNET